jgi:hypothetical protein
MLGITVLYWKRFEVTLARFGISWENPYVNVGTIGNLWARVDVAVW